MGLVSNTESAPLKTQLPSVLWIFSVWTVALTALTMSVKLMCAYVLRLPEAYDFVVFPRRYGFTDFRCFVPRFKDFHHPAFFSADPSHSLTFMYPAPTALMYQFFYRLPKPLVGYIILTITAVVIASLCFAREMSRRGVSKAVSLGFVTMCLICSYPFMVSYFLGNIEIVVGLLIGLGLYFVLEDRPWAAAACFGVAGAAKIFPLVFLALLFTKKQYRQIVFSIALVGVLTVFSLWAVSGSIAVSQRGIADGLEHFRQYYALPFNSYDTGIDHSLFGLIKGSIKMLELPYPDATTMGVVMKFYLAGTAVAGIALYFLRIRFLPVLNQVLCLCTIAILFTPASHDYTLMHLYVPFGMMVLLAIEASRTGQRIEGMTAAFVCLALLLAPLNEFILHGNVIGGQIKAVILTVLLVIALRYRFVGQEQPTIYAPA